MAEPLTSGLWGLACAGNRPVAAEDAAQLHLQRTDGAYSAMGRDGQDPDMVDTLRDERGTTVFTGWIAERSALAARLGLSEHCPSAALASAALARFGADTPSEMLGEWSLFHRDVEGHTWLVQSATARDRLFFAASATGLAFAPDAMALRRLDWVDGGLDSEAVGLSLGRYELRQRMGNRTILRGIEKLPPGGSLRFAPDGTLTRHAAELLLPQDQFTGDAAEALAALEEALRSVLRERLGTVGRSAVLLSGGLDSSLIAALAAQELTEPPLALCSVAPLGSGIPDEAEFARAVAARSVLEFVPVCPPSDADPYCPSPHVLAGAEMPLLSNRHCLTSAFHRSAREHGAGILVNGTYGEMSVTARLPGNPTLRQRLGVIRRSIAAALQPDQRDFHVALAPHLRESLTNLRAETARPSEQIFRAPEGKGYIAGTEKALAQPNAYYAGALRMHFPFRDMRLLRLYASLPRALLYALGPDRGPGRTIGTGLLPEEIRLRQRGMPADPGHYARLQAFAAPARNRIVAFRAAGIDAWIDLAWLDRELARVAIRGVTDPTSANAVQLTAMAAEYLTWAQQGMD
ncbi:MAG: asparagine synthase-related protein [Novosphingobium sp.]